jgi:hypothetical protein
MYVSLSEDATAADFEGRPTNNGKIKTIKFVRQESAYGQSTPIGQPTREREEHSTADHR